MAKKGSAAEALRKAGIKQKNKDKGGGAGKYGRNRIKCERYRNRIGKPNGPGQPGNKAGRNAGV